jgi:hypothetical protein
MTRSDALPPARNRQRSHAAGAITFLALLALLVWLPSLTGCSAASSAGGASAGSSPVTTPRIPPNTSAPPRSLQLSGNFQAALVGTAYTSTLTVGGGSGPFSFRLISGSLPSGLALSATTGTIAGTPSQAGTSTFVVEVSNLDGLHGGNTFQLTVSPAGTIVVTVSPDTTAITSATTAQFTAVVSNTSNVGVTWTASTGTISSSGLYQAPTVTVKTTATVTATSAANPAQSGKATVTITPVQKTPLAVSTTFLPTAISGTAYTATLQASGGTTPYAWSLHAGALPSGLALSSGGSISGTPTQTGQFNVTVEVADSSSPKQTATQALTLTVSSSVTGPTIPASFFGAGFNGSNPWPPTDGQGNPASLVGLRLWDDGVKWGQLNTANGTYDWTPLDNWLGLAESSNMDVLYTFGDTPQFAAGTVAPAGCNSPGPYSCAPPVDVNADGTGTDAYFQAFVTALVTHAAGRISYYELWNEPDCNCFWAGTEAQLVRMGADAAAIIRSLDPNAKILSPSAHGPTMATWFDGYIAAGGAPNFDIVNVHMRGTATTNSNPLAFLTVYGQVETELQKRNLTSLPLWDDEHGINQGNGLTDPDMLAGYDAVSAVLRASVGLQRQYIYTWDSPAPLGLQGNLSGTAWDQVAGWLIGHSISPCVASGTVYSCQLDYGEIVWDSAQTCSNGVCTTSNYTLPQTYAYSEAVSGARTQLKGKTVAIGYQPILLDNQQ